MNPGTMHMLAPSNFLLLTYHMTLSNLLKVTIPLMPLRR